MRHWNGLRIQKKNNSVQSRIDLEYFEITCSSHGRISGGREGMNMMKVCIVGASGKLGQ